MFTFLFVFLAIANVSTLGGLRKQKLCKRKLAYSLYQPEICGLRYLSDLERKLRQYQPLLFTSQRDSIIAGFEQQYGVQVEVIEPFSQPPTVSLKCDTFVQGSRLLQSGVANAFDFNIPSEGTFVSATLTNVQSSTGAEIKYIDLKSPERTYIYLYDSQCGIISTMNTNFADSGTFLDGDASVCDAVLVNGGTAQPRNSFSSFAGEQVKGTWTVYVFSQNPPASTISFTLNICYNSTITNTPGRSVYTRDLAYSNQNAPAYSRENGISKISSVYRNNYDEMLYITISSSNIICPN